MTLHECGGCGGACDASIPDGDVSDPGFLCPTCAALPGPAAVVLMRPRRSDRPLVALGIKAVLAVVERHDWRLRETARELGVRVGSVINFVSRHAPAQMKAARRRGLARARAVPPRRMAA